MTKNNNNNKGNTQSLENNDGNDLIQFLELRLNYKNLEISYLNLI